MYLRSGQTSSIKKAFSITLVSLLLVVSLSMTLQQQIFAFHKNAPATQDKTDTQEDSSIQKVSPFIQFAVEVEKAIETLDALKKTLIQGGQPKHQLAQLRGTL